MGLQLIDETMLDMKDVFRLLRERMIPCSSIVHMGANFAQGRQVYVENGMRKILWIEAIPSIVEHLKMKLHNENDVVLQGCLSDKTGELVTFNVASNNKMSSSIFEFKEHQAKYPNIQMTEKIELLTTKIDDLLSLNNIKPEYDIAVLDLQGAEIKALKGAKNLLDSLKAVVCEVSTIELYKDAPLEYEVDTFMSNNGFTKLASAYTEYGWGETLYVKGAQ